MSSPTAVQSGHAKVHPGVPRRFLILVRNAAVVLIGLGMAASYVRASDGPTQARYGSANVIAILPFQFVGASPAEGSVASDRLREELLATGKFTVMDPARVDAVLNEQAFHQSGCVDVDCAVRVGRLLNVSTLVVGRLTQVKKNHWIVSCSLIGVTSNRPELSASIDYEGDFFALMREGIPGLVAKLAVPPTQATPGVPGTVDPVTLLPADPQPEPEKGFPRSGFALYTGGMNFSGKARLNNGGSLTYSGSASGSLGLEYQWSLAKPWTLGVLMELSGSGQPSGKLGKVYDAGSYSFGGVELRYWMDRWYVGGNFGSITTCFYISEDQSPRTQDQCYYGGAIGAAAGYQWMSGWFVGSSLDYGVLTATEVRNNPRVPKSSTAVEYDWWLNVGYRWGQD